MTKRLVGGLIVFLFVMGAAFYWYEVRPARIRHDCSWVRQTSKAVPGRPAMTEAELRQNGMLKECSNQIQNIFDKYSETCEEENISMVEEYRNPRAAIPLREWWEQADEDEYKFCLHDKGL